MAWARLGSQECLSSSVAAPKPWAASSPDSMGKTHPSPQQSTLGIKHLFYEIYENL